MNYQIQTLNAISPAIYTQLGEHYHVSDHAEQPDAILVRSASMHDLPLAPSVLCIARAGAGTNNIPIDACTDKGIVVFNTPGANANAVKELVITGLLLASRNVAGGIEWAKTLIGKGAEVPKLVEKGKSQFVGPEIKGKKLGVIGLGAIGVMVANAAHNLGMDVVGYDPYLTIDSAWHLSRSIHKAKDMNEVFASCDYITLHVPLNDSTKHMICSDSLKLMKDGVFIVNTARAGLMDEQALRETLRSGKLGGLALDVFHTEPVKRDDEYFNYPNVILTPHIAGAGRDVIYLQSVMLVNDLMLFLAGGKPRTIVDPAAYK